MKLGVFTPLFANLSFEDMLDKVQRAGLNAVEIGTGGNPGNHHCPTDELLESEEKRAAYLDELKKRNLTISAFSCHSNPISPDPVEAKASDEILRKTIRLAALMGVPVVNTFSGTAGDSEEATAPNWPVIPWPEVYTDIYKWQWENKLNSLLERNRRNGQRIWRQDWHRIARRFPMPHTVYAFEIARKYL